MDPRPQEVHVEESVAKPWEWRPSADAWFRSLGDFAKRWQPSPNLGLLSEGLAARLASAAESRAPWLLHPVAGVLTAKSNGDHANRDLQLVARLAAYDTPTPQTVRTTRDIWVWAPDGGASLAAGHHSLSDLAAIAGRQARWPIALDVWCRSIGFPLEGSWAAKPPASPEEEVALRQEIRMFFRAIVAIERYLPECWHWLTSLTRVVVPLRTMKGSWESGSSTDWPAMVWLHLQDGLQILEGLVHETAHQYFFLAEAETSLVDPEHTGRYTSPLRPDKRPLRGILLAYHALAYIAAFYFDAARSGLDPARSRSQLQANREKLSDAQATLVANRRFLTEWGRDFLNRTMEVGRYSEC